MMPSVIILLAGCRAVDTAAAAAAAVEYV